MEVSVVVLAAGKGKRMNSEIPKVLHTILARPMLSYVLDAIGSLKIFKTVIITGYRAPLIREFFKNDESDIYFAYQAEQLGTGHAALCAKKHLESYHGEVLILNGDTPLLQPETIENFIEEHRKSGCILSFISTVLENPTGYGRVLRNKKGAITKIVEEKDADQSEKEICEVNAGVYCVDSTFLWNELETLNPNNKQHEYYLPDIVDVAIRKKEKVGSFLVRQSDEILGVNDRVELVKIESVIRKRKNLELMKSGVTIVSPETTYISPQVKIGIDTVIYPSTYIMGDCSIGWGCIIGPSVWIEDSELLHDVKVHFNSHINQSVIKDGAIIGPFAHIRPETVINSGAKIGNFVEIKKSTIGRKSKVPHLSYVGDATVGEEVNIGAGSITCNYDGYEKHQTVIGDNVFIGSDTKLVAPITVGKDASTGAGSTITKDVPEGALAVERNKQVNIDGWNKRAKRSKTTDQ